MGAWEIKWDVFSGFASPVAMSIFFYVLCFEWKKAIKTQRILYSQHLVIQHIRI